jgi:cell division protease FtsH
MFDPVAGFIRPSGRSPVKPLYDNGGLGLGGPPEGPDDQTNLEIIRHFSKLFDHGDYSDVIQGIQRGDIADIYINRDFAQVVAVGTVGSDGIGGPGAGLGEDYLYDNFKVLDLNPLLTNKLIDRATDANVHITVADLSAVSDSLYQIQKIVGDAFHFAVVSLPYVFASIILYSIFTVRSQMSGMGGRRKRGGGGVGGGPGLGLGAGGSDPFSLMDRSDVSDYPKPNVSLTSWSGSPEVIDECREVISYLENKAAYARVGAEMPKGILLEGPPGTGKTLLAKAIATETNSTFISTSGSEFVELFVGMGAARVRELFDDARENRPAIIFIDEIDAIGKQRGNGAGPMGGGNDEREQTLNQLLYEMDGFNDNTDLVVLAATNRRDILDKALLRPGRFDRVIRVPTPDRESREKILDLYLKNKPLEEWEGQSDRTTLAEITEGFSGAELKNLVNEAAILAARNNQTAITKINLYDAFEKSIVGLIRKNATIPAATQRRVAIHEMGHALMVLEFPDLFDLQKVSIQPTYEGAGGYTLFSEKPEIKEGGLYTKEVLRKRLAITMGGKAAESLMYGDEGVSMGAIQDLNQANQLAKRMVGNFGMGRELEVFYNVEVGEDGAGAGGFGNTYSEEVKQLMDSESLMLVREAYDMAKTVLEKRRGKLEGLSYRLILAKTLMVADIVDRRE